MALLFHHALAWLHAVWAWLQAGAVDHRHPDHAGFLVPIIIAIVNIAIVIGQFVIEIGLIAFKSINAVARFAARGVGWLTGIVRKGYSIIHDAIKVSFDAIQKWVSKLYEDYQKLKDKLDKTFGPIIRTVQKIKKWYDEIWKKTVQPILNAIQRVRKVLAIFKFFHLKWAEKLDADLAHLEYNIAKNFLVLRRYVNLLGQWTDFLVDPAGALRYFPFIAGFIGALDVTFSGLFGTHFHWFEPATGTPGHATSVRVTIGRDLADIRAGTGDAGTVQRQWKSQHDSIRAEMGLH